MSFVHLTVINKNTVHQLYVHYRTAKRILEQGPERFSFLPGKHKDAGYLVVDYDKKQIINCQDAFALPSSKDLEVVEVL